MNLVFETGDFNILNDELENYDKNVRKHYNEYIKTNDVWNIIKSKVKF